MNIAVYGLGYVGLPSALAMADAGHHVVGVDVNEARIERLRAGHTVIEDDYVQQRISSTRLSFGLVAEPADAHIVCVPTPVDTRFDADLSAVTTATKSIAGVLRDGDLVVVESTIYPGVCEETVAPLLRDSGVGYHLAHCPERINPGDPNWNVLNIPRIVGGIDPESTRRAADLYASFLQSDVGVVGSIRAAEATKILENTFRDINIAFVNEMAKSFDRLGIDVLDVIRAASTKPFGFMPFYPGAGVGGHCIAVDPYYMIERGRIAGFDHEFLRLARRINEGMPDFVVELLMDELNKAELPLAGTPVALLGLAYKPGVPDDRESPAYPILQSLVDKSCNVRVYDPFVSCEFSVASLADAVDGAVAAVIVTAHAEFVSNADTIAGCGIVIDGRNCLDRDALIARGIRYRGIGR